MFVLFSVLFFDYSGMAAPRKKDRFFLVCARGGAFEACAAFVAQASLALYRANSEYRCRLPLRRSARAGTGRARGCVASRIRRTSRGCCRMRRGVAKAAHTKMGVCARRTIRGYDRPRACVHGQAAADRCGRSPVKTVKCDDGRGNPDGKAKVAGDRPSVCLCSASGTLGLPCRTAHTARAPAVHSPAADSSRPRPPGRDRASYPRRPRQAKAGSTLHGEARQGKITQGTATQGKAWASLVAFPSAARRAPPIYLPAASTAGAETARPTDGFPLVPSALLRRQPPLLARPTAPPARPHGCPPPVQSAPSAALADTAGCVRWRAFATFASAHPPPAGPQSGERLVGGRMASVALLAPSPSLLPCLRLWSASQVAACDMDVDGGGGKRNTESFAVAGEQGEEWVREPCAAHVGQANRAAPPHWCLPLLCARRRRRRSPACHCIPRRWARMRWP